MSLAIERALADFAAGKFVIVTDDHNRENEGDLIIAASAITTVQTAFMVRHTTGILCVGITEAIARTLHLPMMVENNEDKRRTAFTVSVDLKDGITTGVSAADRTASIRALADEKTRAEDLVRPGHIFPLVAHRQLLGGRNGHTEAAVALAQLTSHYPAAVLAEIVNDAGDMARGEELAVFAREHEIEMISIAELTEYWKSHAAPFEIEGGLSGFSAIPLERNTWRTATFNALKARDHVVMAYGEANKTPMVRIHSECFTGDVMGSRRCDCGPQLQLAMSEIEAHGFGYILYLRDHEGRGIGLTQKLSAYQLQDQGLDTVDANVALGLPVDRREWNDAIDILRELQVKTAILLTNNPEKVAALSAAGFDITQQHLATPIHKDNENYIKTKAERLGHTRGDI